MIIKKCILIIVNIDFISIYTKRKLITWPAVWIRPREPYLLSLVKKDGWILRSGAIEQS